MTFGPNCIALVKEFESLRLEAYPDPGTGAEPFTIAYGHVPAVPGQTITEAAAEVLLMHDLTFACENVLRWFAGVNLAQGMLDALTSLSMNVGSIPVVAPKLTADVREGNFADAAVQFLDIDRDENGRVLPGLERRRQAESTLFST